MRKTDYRGSIQFVLGLSIDVEDRLYISRSSPWAKGSTPFFVNVLEGCTPFCHVLFFKRSGDEGAGVKGAQDERTRNEPNRFERARYERARD